MDTTRYRSTKGANLVAVIVGLCTAALILQCVHVRKLAQRTHASPQLLHHVPQSPLRPDTHEPITPRHTVRLRTA